MSATLTIGGIPLDALAKQPDPQELAAIIARWDAEKQAEFLAELSGGIICGGGDVDGRMIAIAEALLEDREEYGITFCRDIVGHAAAIGAAS